MSVSASEARDRLIAGATSLLVVAIALRVLMLQPSTVHAEASDPPLRVRFIDRAASARIEPAHPADGRRAAHADTSSNAPAASTTTTRATAQTLPRPHVYERDGRLRVSDSIGALPPAPNLPPGSAPDTRRAEARGPFDRVNPVDYRETRFDRAWRGKGTAGDSALEDAHGMVTGSVTIPLGTRDQPARARPPPAVRFNPGLHERTADLGSEATGDAYKAAPIAEEPAPGLDGAASRAIRGQLAVLGRDFAHCQASLFAEFAKPVRLHLSQLEGIEYAFAHGADPVRAEHLLPREADMAYTLARRALWHARQKLSTCNR
ncbi:hypothetical protein ASD72_03775 [Pseudoxanthomonas sp. Root630]|nr:hypothetical protein ASD72_03775 [Pseudoxanthomonas sp. Root630]